MKSAETLIVTIAKMVFEKEKARRFQFQYRNGVY